MTYHTIEDKWIAYLQGEKVKLTDKESEKLQRLIRCNELIEQHFTRKVVLPMLMNLEDIGMSTAVKIFNQTQLVFGKSNRKTKSFWVDLVLGNMVKNREDCHAEGDYKTIQKIDNDMMNAIGKYFDDDEGVSMEDVQPIPIMMSSNPNLIEGGDDPKVLKKMAEKIMQSVTQDAQDTDYESIESQNHEE